MYNKFNFLLVALRYLIPNLCTFLIKEFFKGVPYFFCSVRE